MYSSLVCSCTAHRFIHAQLTGLLMYSSQVCSCSRHSRVRAQLMGLFLHTYGRFIRTSLTDFIVHKSQICSCIIYGKFVRASQPSAFIHSPPKWPVSDRSQIDKKIVFFPLFSFFFFLIALSEGTSLYRSERELITAHTHTHTCARAHTHTDTHTHTHTHTLTHTHAHTHTDRRDLTSLLSGLALLVWPAA